MLGYVIKQAPLLPWLPSLAKVSRLAHGFIIQMKLNIFILLSTRAIWALLVPKLCSPRQSLALCENLITIT